MCILVFSMASCMNPQVYTQNLLFEYVRFKEKSQIWLQNHCHPYSYLKLLMNECNVIGTHKEESSCSHCHCTGYSGRVLETCNWYRCYVNAMSNRIRRPDLCMRGAWRFKLRGAWRFRGEMTTCYFAFSYNIHCFVWRIMILSVLFIRPLFIRYGRKNQHWPYDRTMPGFFSDLFRSNSMINWIMNNILKGVYMNSHNVNDVSKPTFNWCVPELPFNFLKKWFRSEKKVHLCCNDSTLLY